MRPEADAPGAAADHQQSRLHEFFSKLIPLLRIRQVEGAHQAAPPGIPDGLGILATEGLQAGEEFLSPEPGVFHQIFLSDDPQDKGKTYHVDQVAAEG